MLLLKAITTLLPYWLIAVTVLALVAAAIAKKKTSRKTTALDAINVSPRRPLTAFEEQLYFRLASALPECTVLAQVSFQALITTRLQADRNRFDRKIADFVICSKNLLPIAVIELDDASHNEKKKQDAERDELLNKAGYTTIRYNSIPDEKKIRDDIERLLAAKTDKKFA